MPASNWRIGAIRVTATLRLITIPILHRIAGYDHDFSGNRPVARERETLNLDLRRLPRPYETGIFVLQQTNLL